MQTFIGFKEALDLTLANVSVRYRPEILNAVHSCNICLRDAKGLALALAVYLYLPACAVFIKHNRLLRSRRHRPRNKPKPQSNSLAAPMQCLK